jgi:hypothetical protein
MIYVYHSLSILDDIRISISSSVTIILNKLKSQTIFDWWVIADQEKVHNKIIIQE